jgi:hypothetical protein
MPSANALIIGSGPLWPRTCISGAVTFSAPASATLHVPIVSLAPTPDTKDSKVSQTTPFKNVFDSLTLFEELQQEGRAKEEGAAVPNSSTKKELSTDSISGTEEAVVLQAPPPNLPKPPLMLSLSADRGVPQNSEAWDETAGLPPTSSRDDSRENDAATARNQPESLALGLPRTSLSYQTRLDGPIGTSTMAGRSTASTKKGEAVTMGTPTKAQVTARSFETASSAEPEAAQRPAPPTKEPSVATPIQKTLAVKSVSVPRESRMAEPVPEKPLPGTIRLQTTQPETASQPASLAPSALVPSIWSSTSTAMQQAISSGMPKGSPIQSAPTMRSTGRRIAAPTPQQAPQTKTASQAPRISIDSPPAAESSTVVPAEKSTAAILTPPPNVEAPVEESNSIAATPLVHDPSQAATTVRPLDPAQPPSPQKAVSGARPTSTSDATVPSSAGGPSIAPSLIAPTVERGQQAMPAAAAVAASTPSPASPSTGREATDRPSEPSSPSGPQQTLAANTAPKVPLLPQAENFAFQVRMLGLESFSGHSPVTEPGTPLTTNGTSLVQPKSSVTQSQSSPAQQPDAPQGQAANDTVPETQPLASQTEKSEAGAQNQPGLQEVRPTPGVTPHWNEAAVLQASEPGPGAAVPESTEAMHANLPVATQEAHLLTPELPRTSVSSEILLHLTSDDQSSAAIRIADRAGSVNISVHASDPVLRESLKSNLGDLSTQLNAQGWKADVMKSAAVAAHSESQQDSRSSEQRGSQQQQSAEEDRQPQRERRGNGGQWRQELEQQILGSEVHTGGNR